MPRFSKKSLMRLITCHQDLQTLFNEVIKIYDCTILCGHRNKEDQEKAVREGKSKLHYPNSKHNTSPSLAADVAPYPIDWDDVGRFKEFASHVKSVRDQLLADGKIDSNIEWGGDWKTFKDYPHWEIKNAIEKR